MLRREGLRPEVNGINQKKDQLFLPWLITIPNGVDVGLYLNADQLFSGGQRPSVH
jgi:hypothetical protein